MKREPITAAGDGTNRRAFLSTVLPWLVLAIGIPASFFLYTLIQNSVENVARLRFEREANDANDTIEGRLRSYNDVLYALRALFTSGAPVDRLRFHHPRHEHAPPPMPGHDRAEPHGAKRQKEDSQPPAPHRPRA